MSRRKQARPNKVKDDEDQAELAKGKKIVPSKVLQT
jgi:hypothetical protein